MGIRVDFSSVESSDFEPIPASDYLLEIDEVEYIEKSKSSGQPMFKFTMRVVEGEYKGRLLWDNCSLQPQALFKLNGLLEALGFDTDGELDIEPDELVGKQVVGVVKVKPATAEYDAGNNIKRYKSTDSVEQSLLP